MSPVAVSDEVSESLAAGGPVVALETTLVAHGFPGAEGLGAALEAERQVRSAGAVPATVGVVDGEVVVGLAGNQLERFAGARRARKVGPRDIASCTVSGELGATTVGGTLAVARSVGIRFMGTGGTGGVHRGFAVTLDISADLAQMAKTAAVVVASGAKSLLDVEATAQALEALGVPVLGWRTSVMPRFYTSRGGPPVSARVETTEEVAAVADQHWAISGAAGLLLANPPPRDLEVDDLLAEALQQVAEGSVKGPAVTPAVLSRLHLASRGATAELNKQLIAGNARLAAEVAVAYARLTSLRRP
ncbi:MAG: pseudouridine-5'-phosphate glycosidase [Acidimicrobiales bacterium]